MRAWLIGLGVVAVLVTLAVGIVGSHLAVNSSVKRQIQVELRCSELVGDAYLECARTVL